MRNQTMNTDINDKNESKLLNLLYNATQFYTKVFVKLFGDELRVRHNKNRINLRSKCELSEHMKRDIGLD